MPRSRGTQRSWVSETTYKRAFRAAHRAFVEAYKEAFAVFKEGALVGAFPPGGLLSVGWWGSSTDPG